MKTCASCKTPKSPIEFNIDRRCPDGRKAYCRSCTSSRSKIYYQNNLAKLKAVARTPAAIAQKAAYRRRNRNKINAYAKRVMGRPQFKFRIYHTWARRRSVPFSLSFEQFVEFWRQPCHYCGDQIETVGLDRVENASGYIPGNVVPCCRRCNVAKGAMSLGAFYRMCIRIVERRQELLQSGIWHDTKATGVIVLA